MNSENKPANNKGSYNHKNSRKPYYMKKHNRHNNDKINNSANEAENEQAAINADEVINEATDTSNTKQDRNCDSNQSRNRDRRGRNRNSFGNNPTKKADNIKSEEKEPEKETAVPEDDNAYESSFAVAVTDENGNISEGQNMTPVVTVSIENDEQPKTVAVAGIRFKSGGKVYYFDKGELEISAGNFVIVETARGLEFGEVAFESKEIKEDALVLPLKPIVRIATQNDIDHNKENKAREEEAYTICLEKIKKHGLDMKLIEVQYSFDNTKLLFYFTSANRVDFRELVKDLASVFKTRIELRQIGIRDEAKIMGGLGSCGRPLCCSTFLSDFAQVSIKMAKEQNLSLNSGKISGCCGRLMCCLQFEHKTYAEETAKTPPVESIVKTHDGIGTVTETNPLAGLIKVKLKDKPDSPPAQYNRDDVTVISRAVVKDDE